MKIAYIYQTKRSRPQCKMLMFTFCNFIHYCDFFFFSFGRLNKVKKEASAKCTTFYFEGWPWK